ncbi:unnamed protein product [Caenorhabditis auriculariae]|uniref:Uncharacterized protein n=1 Tax=Caenorhabditis auriculariae TaxID=2777116 RepID=A0A8S1HTP1_9PELO|nr:unnamed protein product [Caenorhabditis auriculariae]
MGKALAYVPVTSVLREGVFQGRRTAFAYDHITLKTRHPVRSGKLSNVESRTDWRPSRGCIPGTKDGIRLRPHHVEKHAIPSDLATLTGVLREGCIPGTKDGIRLRPHHVEKHAIPSDLATLTGVLREGVFQGRRTAFAYDHITLKTRHPVRSGKLSNVESRTDWRPSRGCIPGTKDGIRLRPHHVENTPSRPIWQVKQPLTGVLREGVFQGRRTAFAYDHITLKNTPSRPIWQVKQPLTGVLREGVFQGRRTAFAYDHITLKNTPSRPIWQVKQPLTGVLREGVFQGRRTAFAYDHITLKNTPSRPIWQVKQPLTGVLREGCIPAANHRCRLRPHHVENTPSRPIWQVKQRVLREAVSERRTTAVAYDHITLKTRHPVRSGKLSNVESRTDWRPSRGCIPGTKDSIRLRPHHVENTPSRPIWQVKQPLTGVLREAVFQGRRTAFAYDHITLKNTPSRPIWQVKQPLTGVLREGCIPGTKDSIRLRPHHVEKHAIPSDLATLTGVLREGCIPGTKDSIRLRPHHVEKHAIPSDLATLTGVLREAVFQGRRTAFAYDHITLKTRHPVRSGKLSNVESR